MPEVERRRSPVRQRLGDLMVEGGLVDADELAEALEEQRRTGERLGQVLVGRGAITEGQLVLALARQFGVDAVDLEEHVPDFAASRLLRESFARRHKALPVRWDDGHLVVAMANRADVLALDDIRSITGHDVRPVMAEPGRDGTTRWPPAPARSASTAPSGARGAPGRATGGASPCTSSCR